MDILHTDTDTDTRMYQQMNVKLDNLCLEFGWQFVSVCAMHKYVFVYVGTTVITIAKIYL